MRAHENIEAVALVDLADITADDLRVCEYYEGRNAFLLDGPSLGVGFLCRPASVEATDAPALLRLLQTAWPDGSTVQWMRLVHGIKIETVVYVSFSVPCSAHPTDIEIQVLERQRAMVRAALERLNVAPVEIDARIFAKLLVDTVGGHLEGVLSGDTHSTGALPLAAKRERGIRVLQTNGWYGAGDDPASKPNLPDADSADPGLSILTATLLYGPRQKLFDQLWVQRVVTRSPPYRLLKWFSQRARRNAVAIERTFASSQRPGARLISFNVTGVQVFDADHAAVTKTRSAADARTRQSNPTAGFLAALPFGTIRSHLAQPRGFYIATAAEIARLLPIIGAPVAAANNSAQKAQSIGER